MPINMEEFPSNSHWNKDAKKIDDEGRRKLEKVATGRVVTRQKPLLARLFGDNLKNALYFIVYDVLIPEARNTFVSMVKDGIDVMVYGEGTKDNRRGNIRRDRGRSYVSYSKMYDRDSRFDRNKERRRSHSKASHRFDDIVLDRIEDAELVLSNLVDLIDDYGIAKVSDFYDQVDLNADYVDYKWGWDNLSDAHIERERDGWILRMPKPIPLDR